MANISTIKQCIQLCGKAGITPFIWGHRGAGKSSIVKQTAIDNFMGMVDLRCSQLESSDLRGLPKAGGDGRTHYLPPAEMPVGDMSDVEILVELYKAIGQIDDDSVLAAMIKDQDEGTESVLRERIQAKLENASYQAQRQYQKKMKELQPRFERGILFLDEVNRAQDDVQQAVFELVLDKSVGQYVLPPGWQVVAAGNFMEGYMVNGFNDPAFLDRFCHITLSTGESTLEEWVRYMADKHGEHASNIIEFASHNVDHLDGKVEGELGFSVQPSRRSWEMVANLDSIFASDPEAYDNSSRVECLAGLVGRELAISFSRYSCPVKPKDVIEDGVQKHSRKMKNLARNQMAGLMWGLVAYAKRRIDEDDVTEVCVDFADHLVKYAEDKDLVVAFCKALVDDKGTTDNRSSAMISNPKFAAMVSKLNQKKTGIKGSKFIDKLSERAELHKALSKVTWGDDE